ncbi:MAG: YceI family protein [Bacteroidia bacterium]|jgi:polyisoprenoid-binding protein YceI
MSKQAWALDPTHSEIQFKVKHLMISTVTGNFHAFSANVETDGDDFSTANISFSADIDSISTGDAQRDGHLKSPDFFDAAQFPTITFESTSLKLHDGDIYKLSGNLTMHGVTKAVELEAELGGIAKDPWGNTKVGFTLSGKVNRKDFGLNWNVALEAGGILVGDEVKLHAEVQFVKQ